MIKNIPKKHADKKRRCKCCRHTPPHCTCKLDRPPRPMPQPVTSKPEPCQLSPDWLNLFELAYVIGQALNLGITTLQIAGAVRHLGLKNDRRTRPARVRGCVIYRQQTMVHTGQLPRIQSYIEESQ
jgi:hypothetical protein